MNSDETPQINELQNCEEYNYHLHEACRTNNFNRVKELLDCDIAFLPTSENHSAFRYCCAKGLSKIVELFLQDCRFDPTIGAEFYMSEACLGSHVKVMKILLKDNRMNSETNRDICLRIITFRLKQYSEMLTELVEHK